VGAGRSVTTSGRIIDQPLAKAHCGRCALVQRTAERYLAAGDYYEKRYSFYERPGAERFDRERYDTMASWIAASVPNPPRHVLDAGCGRGWMLEAMRRAYPNARFRGIEPSEAESENARSRGFNVTTARVGTETVAAPEFDLVYATNVVEHTDAPADFLRALRRMLAPGGRIVITCPDATRPNQEMMFSDQNFSMLPVHLGTLAAQAGLVTLEWVAPPAHLSVRDKQLVVLGTDPRGARRNAPPPEAPDGDRLYDWRCQYLASWTACHEKLKRECVGAAHVYHFGTSTWSFLLAGYCPDYWSLVTSCAIDGGSGEFLGKPVVDAEHLSLGEGDVVVMGVDPDRQQRFAERFGHTPARRVTWNDVIPR
jgi:2-polyprenyl-3-methyl-5-hydroxy-6-metoxy-1,4-benzoquinol methylase